MYLRPDEYKGNIPADELEDRLKAACRDIDSLTFDRIVKQGFENLTQFQQKLIKEAVQLHADFCFENADLLDSPHKSKVVTTAGVTTSSRVYNLLMQTGLCYRGLM